MSNELTEKVDLKASADATTGDRGPQCQDESQPYPWENNDDYEDNYSDASSSFEEAEFLGKLRSERKI